MRTIQMKETTQRLEMAHIKMQAAIEISSKYQITDKSLLRWRRKLKRASLECNHAMRESKRRSQEDKRFQEQIKQSSFPRRIAHATKSFMSLVAGKKSECSSKAAARRFERLADGATDFLTYVQLGGTPRQYMFFDPLITHLFAGKFVHYEMSYHNQYHYFGLRPMSSEGHGLHAFLGFAYEDHDLPEHNFHIGFMLRLSESTNIIGTTIQCLQLVTPHFKSAAEVVIKELAQLPTQDFCWLLCNTNVLIKQCNSIDNTLNQFLRPNPLCCQGYDLPSMPPVVTGTNASRLSSIFPEPVCHMYLQRHIPLSDHNSIQGRTIRCKLKLGVLFAPHDSVDDFESTAGAESFATEAIDGEKQECTHYDAHLHQIDEMLLPKAIDYLSGNPEAATYKISWKSRHGSAHLCVEKIISHTATECRAAQGGKKIKLLELQDRLSKGQWKQIAAEYLKVWGLQCRSLGC